MIKKSLLLIVFNLISYYHLDSVAKISRFEIITNETLIKTQEQYEWENLIKSIIWVESKNNDLAIGTTHDGGCLQITPIYLEDCNRILGENKYSLQDRFDRQKSLEMFEIYQSFYNPNKNKYKAIKLHNPGAGQAYRDSILYHFKRYAKS